MITEPSSGEHNKIKHWLNGLMKIPFGKFKQLPHITKQNPTKFIVDADKKLNECCYGMKDAKDHVIRYLAQLITNPKAVGNCIGMVGAPGTGKTSLIQDGVSKILGRPFHFISLGGSSDASLLEGHN